MTAAATRPTGNRAPITPEQELAWQMVESGGGTLNMRDYLERLNELPSADERPYNTEDAITHLNECLFLRRVRGCLYERDIC